MGAKPAIPQRTERNVQRHVSRPHSHPHATHGIRAHAQTQSATTSTYSTVPHRGSCPLCAAQHKIVPRGLRRKHGALSFQHAHGAGYTMASAVHGVVLIRFGEIEPEGEDPVDFDTCSVSAFWARVAERSESLTSPYHTEAHTTRIIPAQFVGELTWSTRAAEPPMTRMRRTVLMRTRVSPELTCTSRRPSGSVRDESNRAAELVARAPPREHHRERGARVHPRQLVGRRDTAHLPCLVWSRTLGGLKEAFGRKALRRIGEHRNHAHDQPLTDREVLSSPKRWDGDQRQAGAVALSRQAADGHRRYGRQRLDRCIGRKANPNERGVIGVAVQDCARRDCERPARHGPVRKE
eukprot:5156837-Prymnesium_polylepis.1